jgi:hypothetical protein
MLISFGYDISLRLEVETAVLFCLRVHPSRTEDIVSGENFRIEPQSPFEQYLDGFGNICGRVHCKPGIVRFVNQGVIRDSGQLDAYEPSAAQDEVYNRRAPKLEILISGPSTMRALSTVIHARNLCAKLRAQLPNLKIAVGLRGRPRTSPKRSSACAPPPAL